MPEWLYFSRLTNIAFHNLTQSFIPVHLKSLLGLGLNYCICQPGLLGSSALDFDQFKRNMYTKMIFAGQAEVPPPLYTCSNWEPNPSVVSLEL